MPAPPAQARRLFVYGFLVVLLATSAAGVEAWPLTGWRLFSQVRTSRVAGWQVVAVDARGVEQRLDVASLGRGYRGASWILGEFASMTPARRDAVCRAWETAAERRGAVAAASLRIYRTVRVGPNEADRTLRYECGRRP